MLKSIQSERIKVNTETFRRMPALELISKPRDAFFARKHMRVNGGGVIGWERASYDIFIVGCGAASNIKHQTKRKKVMNKLLLFAAVLLVAGQASAYAESGDHVSKHHKRMLSSHAQWRGDGGINYRAPQIFAPSYGSFGDDPEAEGRTSGG
jgi:hypothetical protein